MRVLQVHTRHRNRGGEDTVVEAEARALRMAGHEVATHSVENPTGALETVGALAAAVWNERAARDALNSAREFRPDVVHVHNTWFSLSPAVFTRCHQAGFPTVLTLHNYRLLCLNALLFREGRICTDCVGASPIHGVTHGCYRDSRALSSLAYATTVTHRRLDTWNRHVDRFVALTEFAKDLHVGSGAISEDKVVVKPNFVSDEGRRALSPSRSNVVLVVGRVSQEKGSAMVAEAWDSAPSDFKLSALGEGPLLQRLASEHPNIEFVGSVGPDQVADAMRTSRALLFPSMWFEGQPMVLLEAMAAGLPVIASRVGAIPEILASPDPMAIPQPTTSEWASALSLLHDTEWLDSESIRLRSRYEAEFSEDVGVRRLEELYGTVTR